MNQSKKGLGIGQLVFAGLVAAVTLWSFLVSDAKMFQYPALARIFFWHFPCPMMLTALLFAGTYFSLRQFLRLDLQPETDPEARRRWDVRAESALELGLIFAILTMATGVLFSLAQWGAMWQWDPRQTSFLIALLIYAAYFALREAYSDPEKRAMNSAAYILTAFIPLVFLIFVFPRLPQVQEASFHPSQTVMGGQLKGQYLYVTLSVLTLVSCLSVWLYRLRVRAGLLEIEHGKLEDSRRSASPTSVVRPVRLSDPS